MTTHTPDPAQQDFIAAELRGIIEVCGDSPTAIVSVERMRLWLSKLRAPVATTTDRAMLQSVLQDLENSDSVCPRCGHSDSCADMDVAYMIRDHLKAEVHAPVAGEAQNSDSRYAAKSSTYDAARIVKLPTVDAALAAFIENSDGNTALALVQAILDAAPQASAEPTAFAKDGNLFWYGDHAARCGFNGDLYLAPQASEAVRKQALAALESAQRFIRNGVEFGYVRMPDADTPDPAHRTPGLIDAAIRALSAQPGAQKDRSQ